MGYKKTVGAVAAAVTLTAAVIVWLVISAGRIPSERAGPAATAVATSTPATSRPDVFEKTELEKELDASSARYKSYERWAVAKELEKGMTKPYAYAAICNHFGYGFTVKEAASHTESSGRESVVWKVSGADGPVETITAHFDNDGALADWSVDKIGG